MRDISFHEKIGNPRIDSPTDKTNTQGETSSEEKQERKHEEKIKTSRKEKTQEDFVNPQKQGISFTWYSSMTLRNHDE